MYFYFAYVCTHHFYDMGRLCLKYGVELKYNIISYHTTSVNLLSRFIPYHRLVSHMCAITHLRLSSAYALMFVSARPQGFNRLMQQFYALFTKRMLFNIRHPKIMFLQCVMPCIPLLIVIASDSGRTMSHYPPFTLNNLSRYAMVCS